MSEHRIRRCDECEAVQGDDTIWWCAVGDPRSPKFTTFAAAVKIVKNRRDLCSHKCVTTAFHRWLDTGSIEKGERDAGRMEVRDGAVGQV